MLTDLEGMATSAPVLLTRTRAQERAVEDLVARGDVLLLRTLYPEMPDAFVAITGRTPRKVAEFSRSEARLHALAVQEIGAEDMNERGRGATLGELAAAIPSGTLGDLAGRFPGATLLDVAATDWKAPL